MRTLVYSIVITLRLHLNYSEKQLQNTKIGNSRGVRIPKAIIKQANLEKQRRN